ncbi:hypothetical protein BDN71DRAFT_1509189 [Pleurotus eryngii]|uniref:Uncharacterized protein n=1 Tax=Pleurotus eryngii TaxID=5323 RepID=A0A9P5ZR42_PLEER|nr:hypothetical protein BDN71DRAFT_1509189 [Pleurotus eryngii]
MESDPWELKSDDIVEFGIDIVGDSNKILHCKVAARQQQQQQHQQALQPHGAPPSLQAGPSSSTINNWSFNFDVNNGSGPLRRTSSGIQPGIAGMGGMGGGMRAPGKSGLTFGHILNRLQGELQKSRETGTELQSLNWTMGEVHDTLGDRYPQIYLISTYATPRSPPSNLGSPCPRTSTRTPPRHPTNGTRAYSKSRNLSNETSASYGNLFTPMDIPPSLNSLTETEEPEREAKAGQSREQETSQPRAEKVRDVEEEAEDADRRQRQEELGRPRNPEPASLRMGADLFTDAKHSPQYAQSVELLDALNSRLLLLSNQFESFMTLTTSLQAQHDAAQPTILNLQAKVVELEDKVKTSQSGQEEVISASISAATAVVASAFGRPNTSEIGH